MKYFGENASTAIDPDNGCEISQEALTRYLSSLSKAHRRVETSAGHELVRRILSSAETALSCLREPVGSDISAALGRAHARGKTIETLLNLLHELLNLRPVTTNSEVHRGGCNLKPKPNLYLTFESSNTPEGKLRDALLLEDDSDIVGVSGMPGVGKTSALVALGHDKDV